MTMCLSEDDGGDGEEDCKFHGPAMDVILVVQNDGNDLIDSDDADDATNEDVLEKKSSNKGAEEIYFFQLKKALYGSLYAPKEVDDKDRSIDSGVEGGMGKNTNGTSSLTNRALSEDEWLYWIVCMSYFRLQVNAGK
eukprot:CAMPEP_0196165908 /NCGR_PEP_ID=MMETSP0911-20130528/1616_1 /TAXON_ID=49265 /ORGANISM="Thalassiosira rotula, Strain GSO102" /LENGTH=136 /DNA_ID=CAMNT_0041431429 /DNA_START=899 /DNA_END=1308 /DNA_ORIENTATION=-